MKTTTARPSARGVLLAGIAVLALILSMLSPLSPTSVAPAQANPSTGFDPGNIIDDAVFYDGAAWDASQIQSFLNQKVPRCTIGDPGRAPWSPFGATFIASVCLKDARFSTPTRAASAYCKAYHGGTNESVATIIAKVSRACSISPKVLLVMFEKEQSLITDTWPTAKMYDYALGVDCPDSGPNNSANCNPKSAGFPLQTYLAAERLQYYKVHSNGYNYKPFQTNTIQWHPNAGCGTSRVYISNWATAALYIYTPYRPNQAALNAGWGTGDSCSSYGNRNFYNFYTSWFGSVRGATVDAKFQQFYAANGGASGIYGTPIASAKYVGIGVVQEFSGGTLYWNPYVGVGAVNGAIRTYYVAQGGPFSSLGYPVGAETQSSGGARQKFEKGEVYWKNATGAQPVRGAVLTHYLAQGQGALGFPTAGEQTVAGGIKQEFEKGTVYWSSKTAAQTVSGGLRSEYNNQRGAGGALGFPTSRMVSLSANGGGWYQHFSGGTLSLAKGASKTQVLRNGPFRTTYLANGGPSGAWGWLTGGAVCGLRNAGCKLPTQFGVSAYTASTGVQFVPTPVADVWKTRSYEAGTLGYPIAAAEQRGQGWFQEFEGGSVMSTPSGSYPLGAELTEAWKNPGGGLSKLGFVTVPTKRVDANRYYVSFELGDLYIHSGKKAIRFGNGPFLDAYRSGSGPLGTWGWPVAPAVCGLPGGGCTMQFENGTANYTPALGVSFVVKSSGAQTDQQPTEDADKADEPMRPETGEPGIEPEDEGSEPPATIEDGEIDSSDSRDISLDGESERAGAAE